MLALPLELQLLIIENLDALDVFRLQLTCKSLNCLIDQSGKTVWRTCLERHCTHNGLFKPSFKELVTQDELKKAASASHRFARAYRRAAGAVETREIGQRRTRLKFPLSEVPEVMANINELYLVPGGRFLITFNDAFLLMWDLSKAPTLDLVLKRPIGGHESVAYTNLLEGEKVHIIYEVEGNWPEGYTPNTPEDGPWDTVTVFEFIELYFSQDDSRFHCKDLGRFTLIHPETIGADAFSIIDDKVVMLIDGVTIAWNFVNNTFAAWKLSTVATIPVEVMTNSEYVMYITSEGIHGVRFPEFEPISGGYAVYNSITTIIHPDFSKFHGSKYDFTPTDLLPIQVFGPDIVTPVDQDHPFIYDVRQAVVETKAEGSGDSIEDRLNLLPPHVAQIVRQYKATGQLPLELLSPGQDTDEYASSNDFVKEHIAQLAAGHFSIGKTDMEVHRHRFLFNASDPAQSTLELISSQRALVRNYNKHPGHNLYANYYERCDGQTVTLWREVMWERPDDEVNYPPDSVLLLSMSDIPSGIRKCSKTPSRDRGELPLVPLIDLRAESLAGDNGLLVADCMVDPASGKAVVLWVDSSAIGRVDLIEVE